VQKTFTDRCAGDVMRVALAILCVGAVAFLLRVLAALVKEGMSLHSSAVRVHLAKFNPSRKRGELIEMNSGTLDRNSPGRTGERIAL